MGLDIHVMRPCRFFTRDFIGPVERDLKMKVNVVGALTLPLADAELVEAQLYALAKKHSGQECRISSEDTVVYSEQLRYDPWHHLREYAAYQDYPFYKIWPFSKHPFERGRGNQATPAVEKCLNTRRTRFPNIVFHDDTSGFYFPVDLRFPVQTQWGYLGSTQGLGRELNAIKASLTTSGYWHQELDYAISVLMDAVTASIRSGFPIIHDG